MKQDVQTYNIMDRMRSYSSAFSRALFTDIIKYGDSLLVRQITQLGGIPLLTREIQLL